jgi:hypothetical protein
MLPQEQLQYNFYNDYINFFKKNKFKLSSGIFEKFPKFNFFKNFEFKNFSLINNNIFIRVINKKLMWGELDENFDENIFRINDYTFFNNLSRKDQIFFKSKFINIIKKNQVFPEKILYNYNDFLEVNRWVKRSQGSNTPLRLIKYPISNKINYHSNNEITELFKFRFNENEQTIKHKPVPHSTFLTMKQKRYKRRKIIPARIKFEKDVIGKRTKKIR